MARRKREAVTVSFHYLVRRNEISHNDFEEIPFSEDEFSELVDRLQSIGAVDLDNETVKDRVRLKKLVPIEDVGQLSDRIAFGRYRAAYWGHAYHNTVVGKIPADSISLRPFYFIAYLSRSGKIYLGVQYLGQFGSYEGLKNTILGYMSKPKEIVAHSFRHDAAYLEGLEPSEVQVRIAKPSPDISRRSTFSDGALVTFKKQNRDVDFASEVRRRLLPALGTSIDAAKKAASQIINDSGLLDVKDEDIVDCTIIGNVEGRRKTIYMISPGVFASQFHISPSFDEDGHPEPKQTMEQMRRLLEERIIAIIKE